MMATGTEVGLDTCGHCWAMSCLEVEWAFKMVRAEVRAGRKGVRLSRSRLRLMWSSSMLASVRILHPHMSVKEKEKADGDMFSR